MKKVAFHTLGCKVNMYETNGMIQKFEEAGYEIVDFSEYADIYVVNTCTVTSISDKKSRQFLRQAKKINPNGIIVAAGCYVQASPEDVKKISEIDVCIGTNEKTNIVQFIEEYIYNNNKLDNENQIKFQAEDVFSNPEYSEFGTVTYTETTRAVIKVQDGCDRFCSYCLIPYARGRVRSRAPEAVIKEVSNISKNGIKEVVLTGIHLASYGKDFKNDYKLIDLLEEINKIDGIERVRLGSIEPLLITEEFMNRFSKLEKMCHHFHLSLQSGCNSTLERMNRRYTTEQFEEIVNRIRNTYSDAILTTDIIVGFPGETDEEFEKTYEFLKKIRFYKMHVFKYSVRRGTKAEKMEKQQTPEIKEKRSNILLGLSDKYENEHLNEYLNKELEVLFEEREGEFYKGHTSNYLTVKTKCNENLSNCIKNVNVAYVKNLEIIANLIM